MTLVSDHSQPLRRHVEELRSMGLASDVEADHLLARIDALEHDMEMAYDRDPEVEG